MTWRGTATPIDRFWASLVYLLPLTSALALSQGLFQSVPALIPLFLPLFKLAQFMNQFGGFTSLVLFLVLFFLVARNERIAHFVRFNTMQALLVDIARYLAVLLLGLLSSVFGDLGLGLLIQSLATTLFLGILAITLFAWVQNIRGLYAEVPVISEAAHAQIRS